MHFGRRILNFCFGFSIAGCALLAPSIVFSQAFKAPPRTISDITAILDQEKPDASRIEKLKAQAESIPPAGARANLLAQFHFDRGLAMYTLGRNPEAIEEMKKAFEIARKNGDDNGFRIAMTLANLYRTAGEHKQALEIQEQVFREFTGPGRMGRQFNVNRQMMITLLHLGEVERAERLIGQSLGLYEKSQKWPNVEAYRGSWLSNIEEMRARLFDARGRYAEAERAYNKARALWDASISTTRAMPNPPPLEGLLQNSDFLLAFEGRSKLFQGKLVEAEADMRRALLNRLKANGKFHADTGHFVGLLGRTMLEQGRYPEAEKLARTAIEIYQSIGYGDDSPHVVASREQLAGIMLGLGRHVEVLKIFEEIDRGISKWDPKRADRFRLSGVRIVSLYDQRRAQEGVQLAKLIFDSNRQRYGDKHTITAMAQGVYAIGLFATDKRKEALDNFRAAIPILLGASRESDDEDVSAGAAREERLRSVVGAYIALLASAPELAGGADKVAEESFPLAEILRGRTVQKALAASSARATARDPALADLVRREQDLEKQISAQLGTITNMLSLPPEERSESELKALRAELEKFRKERAGLRRNIEQRFPNYAQLIDPKAPTIAGIRAALKQDEVFISFYFGGQSAYVWAIPKEGKAGFAALPTRTQNLETRVNALRKALDPQAASVEDIPAFDLKLAHELYQELLAPVEVVWKPAKTMVVVTNGALGLLPLGLLPTAAVEVQKGDTHFAEYKNVPWLAKTHSIAMLPAAAALLTLRNLPAGSLKRDGLIAFGDPYFSNEQAQEAEADSSKVPPQQMASRGIPLIRRNASKTLGVDSAELGLLPRLPDTAEEVKSIAIALQADPTKVLHLGKAANEKTVKTIDLSKFKIVVFATHGLVPGELNGLTQPALALTAPDVADVDGDGLLTMEEILALKLDADWVVLSACNTGTGAGAGAEAASGLGRAFFYAGTRALLVTNWSVHSASARELVADLFARQAANPKLARGEALRQAMMALVEQGGFKDASGKMLFSYAHPLFWAPYTIIGDGGV